MSSNPTPPPIAAGIDIGGTKTSAILSTRGGSILAHAAVPTPAGEGGPAMSAAAAGLIRRLEETSGFRAVAAGVGAAGVIDQLAGVVTAASASFAGWAGFPLAADLGERTGLPVVIDNDVNAFLRGEMSYGSLQGVTDALGIMLGTGVGGAIAWDGMVFSGPRGAAGEIGHTPGYGDIRCTCGQYGHLETLASGRSISERFAEAVGSAERLGAAHIAGLAREGDRRAVATFDAAGRALALAMSTAANLLDVRDVVVGGGVRGAWDLLEPALHATLADNMPVSGYPLLVHAGVLGSHSAALGAAAAAWQLIDTATLENNKKAGVTS
ncbi:ROK family protein [Specibacter cremeus]|uniref:ROK family protein n=1 Tax=Specibacter cremeus TaxID=1629051 RepID=UPI001F0B87CA|nr:ROK family protein [Specibacter cremeus]